jgi:hypothetical protein
MPANAFAGISFLIPMEIWVLTRAETHTCEAKASHSNGFLFTEG